MVISTDETVLMGVSDCRLPLSSVGISENCRGTTRMELEADVDCVAFAIREVISTDEIVLTGLSGSPLPSSSARIYEIERMTFTRRDAVRS